MSSQNYLKKYKTEIQEKINISKFNMEFGWSNNNGECQSQEEGFQKRFERSNKKQVRTKNALSSKNGLGSEVFLRQVSNCNSDNNYGNQLQSVSVKFNNNAFMQNPSLLFTQNNYHTGKNVIQLMTKLKELLKELCLTRNSTIQIQEKLGKIIVYFKDTVQTNGIMKKQSNKDKRVNNQGKQNEKIKKRDSYSKQNHRVKSLQKRSNKQQSRQTKKRTSLQSNTNKTSHLAPSYPSTSNHVQIPGLQPFLKYFSGTIFQSTSSKLQYKLNWYQKQLVQQFFQNYIFLLQKLVNRISKYNGQKKLKYLLQTTMKQIFVFIMRFAYETRIEIYKRERKNVLNYPGMRAKILSETVWRIFNAKSSVRQAFKMIKAHVLTQNEKDMKFVNNIQLKLNFLNNLLRINQRKQIRRTFLQWRKQTTIAKKLQKKQIFQQINNTIREILVQFALNKDNLSRWKVIIWKKLGQMIRKFCRFGDCVLIPMFDVGEGDLDIQSRAYELTQTNRSPINQYHPQSDTYRYSADSLPISQEVTQRSQTTVTKQKTLLLQIMQIFTKDQLNNYLTKGQIFFYNQNVEQSIILIPIGPIQTIAVIRYKKGLEVDRGNFEEEYSRHRQGQSNVQTNRPSINISNFYNILSCLQMMTPMIIDLVQMGNKFEYFYGCVKKNEYQRWFLEDVLRLNDEKLEDDLYNEDIVQNNMNLRSRVQKNKNDQNNEYIFHKSILKLSPSSPQVQQQQQHLLCQQQQQQQQYPAKRLTKLNQILNQLQIKNIFVYHKQQQHVAKTKTHNHQVQEYKNCMSYSVQQNRFGCEKILTKDMIRLVFNKMQIKVKQLLIQLNNNNNNNSINNNIEQQLIMNLGYNNNNKTIIYALPIIQTNNLIGIILILVQNNNNNNQININKHNDKSFLITNKQFQFHKNNYFIDNNNLKNNKNLQQQINEKLCFIRLFIVSELIQINQEKKKLNQSNLQQQQKCCQYCCINDKRRNKNKLFLRNENKIKNIIRNQQVFDYYYSIIKKLFKEKQIIKLMVKYGQTKLVDNDLYQLETQLYGFVSEKVRNHANHKVNISKTIIKNIKPNQNSKFINSQLHQNLSLIEQQLFFRICYFKTMKSKDKRKMSMDLEDKPRGQNKQKQKNDELMYFISESQERQEKMNIKRQYFKIPKFIDQLKVFQNIDVKGFGQHLQQKYKLLQISIYEVIKIFKQMSKKFKTSSKNKTTKPSIPKIQQPQTQTQTHLIQNFISNMLKSFIYLKDDFKPISQQVQRQYNCLQLFLYQLQHLQKQNSLQIDINLVVYGKPVFVEQGDKKRRYLAGMACTGRFMAVDCHQKYQAGRNRSSKIKQSDIRNQLLLSISQSISNQIMKHILQIKLMKNKHNKKISSIQQKSKSLNKKQKLQNKQSFIKKLKQFYKINQNQVNYPELSKQYKIFSRGKQTNVLFINKILLLQSLLVQKQRFSVKQIVRDGFMGLYNERKLKVIQKFINVLQSKIQENNTQVNKTYYGYTRRQFILKFLSRINEYVFAKAEHYLKYSYGFVNVMNKVFVMNKMYKYSFDRMVKGVFVVGNGDGKRGLSAQKIRKAENNEQIQHGISFNKKIFIMRLQKILVNILFDTNANSNKSYQYKLLDRCHIKKSFIKLHQTSQLNSFISKNLKKQSIIKSIQILKSLINKKCYLPYIQKLSQIQKNIHQSIFLIGQQIQSIKFYSLYQFLKFINQRMNVILASQRKLIEILYDKRISKVEFYLVVKEVDEENHKEMKIRLSQKEKEKLICSQISKKYINQQKTSSEKQKLFKNENDVLMIQILQQQSSDQSSLIKTQLSSTNIKKKLYFAFQITQQQQTTNTNKPLTLTKRKQFTQLKTIIHQLLQRQILKSFNKFWSQYQIRLKTFVSIIINSLKLNKLDTFYYQKKYQNNQQAYLKHYGFNFLKKQFFETIKYEKIKGLESEIQRKNKEYEMLEELYQKNQMLLVAPENNQNRTPHNRTSQLRQNADNNPISNNPPTQPPPQPSEIISKSTLKSLKSHLQNLYLKQQNLSIQYQIKSKTVSGYQIMSILQRIGYKNGILQAGEELMTKQKGDINKNKQNIDVSGNVVSNNNTRSRNMVSSDIIAKKRQNLNSLKTNYLQQKHRFDTKMKQKGIKIMSRILKSIHRTSFKKVFNLFYSYGNDVYERQPLFLR